MKSITQWLLRHGFFPRQSWLRRRMLASIYRPAANPAYGIDGWYDLGEHVTREMVERFKQWAE